MNGDRRSVNTVQEKSERRSEKLAELATRVLDAAEAIVATAGLPGLRARDVAERAGCSVGAIYSVFPDLDALVLAVNGRTLAAIVEAMGRADDPPHGPVCAEPVKAPAAGTPFDKLRTDGARRMLERMAAAYLDYAAQHRPRWAALFQHRMPTGRAITPAYAAQQAAAFALIEAPLAVACPGVPDPAIVARSLFSAVHGMVELGLDERIAPMPLPVLQEQMRAIVAAIVRGLALDPVSPGLTRGPA